MKPKLSSNLILRVDEELKRRLADVQSQTGYSVSEVVRQCLNSFVDYFDKNGCIILPLSVVPTRELELLRHSKRAGRAKKQWGFRERGVAGVLPARRAGSGLFHALCLCGRAGFVGRTGASFAASPPSTHVGRTSVIMPEFSPATAESRFSMSASLRTATFPTTSLFCSIPVQSGGGGSRRSSWKSLIFFLPTSGISSRIPRVKLNR